MHSTIPPFKAFLTLSLNVKDKINSCTNCVVQGVYEKLCFFPRILESLPPLPRQDSAAVGCTKNYQPIGVTVHSHCVESFEGIFSDVGEGGVAVNCEKTQFFLITLYKKG